MAVLATGLVVAFELLDATALIGTVLGAAGLVGLALGFVLRDTVENYIAGVLLSMRQPFVRNDWVEIEGQEGHVLRLTSRATIIMTLDGNHVRIPNAMVFNRIVINGAADCRGPPQIRSIGLAAAWRALGMRDLPAF